MLSKAIFLAANLVGLASALNYNKSINSQVRSAYHGSTGMAIGWNTFYQLANPTVKYGYNPGSLVYTASSTVSNTYNTSLTYNNFVLLEDLLPNIQYYYLPTELISNDTEAGPFTFVTSRPLGDATPYSTAVVVDMGAMGNEGLTTSAGAGTPQQDILMPGEQNTIQSLTKLEPTYDFLLHPGDLAYADTWLKETNSGFLDGNATYAEAYKAYESILDDFYDEMTTVTTQKAYMVGPGNHEANCVNAASPLCMPGQENFTGYRNHFRMPSDVATQATNNYGNGNMWYSFDQGMVHYTILDTETDFPGAPDIGYPAGPFGAEGAQVAWLQADLAAVNRTITPWIIVALHRPWYSSGGTCPQCQAAFEPLIDQYNVDLVITGHYHVYERNAPIHYNGTIDPNGLNNPSSPWYIINGLGGHYGGLDPFNRVSGFQEYGLSILNATYGWSRLTFHNCTHMTHELVNSSSNAVLDTATLYKARTCPTSIINNYILPGYGTPQALPGAIVAPRGFLGYQRFAQDLFNPSHCAKACNAISGCEFFVVYVQRQNGHSTGTNCAFFTQAWGPSFATNLGQGYGFTISDAYSYTRVGT